MAGTQVALIVLKLTERFDKSWWFVFIPTIAWILGGLLWTATHPAEQNDNRRDQEE
jgi:glycerol uptake facilitator-like aquaporin